MFCRIEQGEVHHFWLCNLMHVCECVLHRWVCIESHVYTCTYVWAYAQIFYETTFIFSPVCFIYSINFIINSINKIRPKSKHNNTSVTSFFIFPFRCCLRILIAFYFASSTVDHFLGVLCFVKSAGVSSCGAGPGEDSPCPGQAIRPSGAAG